MESQNDSSDESYWRSLLTDREASIVDPSADSPDDTPLRAFTAVGRIGAARRYAPAGLYRSGSDDASSSGARPIDMLWAAAEHACNCDEVIPVEVTGFNRGGVLIDWLGLHGFVPASHLVGLPASTDENVRKQEFSKRVGQNLRAKIVELDRPRGRFVLSERLAYNDKSRLERLMAEMQPGQKRCGVVTTVCDFGAFVDLGGIEGLAHISEISWGRINHPADVLHCGQQVDVYVMSIDGEQKRVALSLKRLQPDPWATIEQRYVSERVVEGVVTTVVDFGAFVKLEEGVEGLIHISELAEGNFLHPNNVVHEGDVVRVRILNIDPQHRRLGLSLRQAQAANPAQE